MSSRRAREALVVTDHKDSRPRATQLKGRAHDVALLCISTPAGCRTSRGNRPKTRRSFRCATPEIVSGPSCHCASNVVVLPGSIWRFAGGTMCLMIASIVLLIVSFLCLKKGRLRTASL